jgi:protein TonB
VSSIPIDPRLPRTLALPRPGAPSPALVIGLLASGILHLVLLLGVSIAMPEPAAPIPETMEILILKDGGVAPPTPDPNAALSQQSRAGESARGDSAVTSRVGLDALPEAVREGIESLNETFAEQPPPLDEAAAETPAPAPAPQEERPALAVERVPEPSPKPGPPLAPDILAAEPREPVDTAQILSSRDQEIARLTASLEARTAAYSSRQRRKSVSASTRELRYASYLGAWASKVERIGNLNYPQAAKDRQIYGSLILHVGVRADGSVESVRVVRSSGYDLLDQAAIRIVELAGPYAPFPPDIAAETDVLDIVRTWQFLRGGRFGWEP